MAARRLCYLTTFLYSRAFKQMTCVGVLLNLALDLFTWPVFLGLIWNVQKFLAASRVEFMKACLFKIILNWCNIFKVPTLGGVLLTLLGGVSCNSEVWGLEWLTGSGTWLTDAVVARLAHVWQTVGGWKLLFFPDSRRNTCLFASQNFRQILFRGFSNWQVLV